jgi:hypothetical protein
MGKSSIVFDVKMCLKEVDFIGSLKTGRYTLYFRSPCLSHHYTIQTFLPFKRTKGYEAKAQNPSSINFPIRLP